MSRTSPPAVARLWTTPLARVCRPRSAPQTEPAQAVASPGMLTLHLVRHGRTVFNTERRLQGWCDSPLTADGLVGVRSTASHLAATRLDAAYTSPSGRTRTTAAEILAHHPGTPLVAVDGLKEMSFGDLEASPRTSSSARSTPGSSSARCSPGPTRASPGANRRTSTSSVSSQPSRRSSARNLDDEHVLVVSPRGDARGLPAARRRGRPRAARDRQRLDGLGRPCGEPERAQRRVRPLGPGGLGRIRARRGHDGRRDPEALTQAGTRYQACGPGDSPAPGDRRPQKRS